MKCKFIEKSLIFTLFFLAVSPLKAQEWILNLKNPEMPFQFYYGGQGLSSAKAEKYSDEVELETSSAKLSAPISKDKDFKQALSLDYSDVNIRQINADANSPLPENLTELKGGHQFISTIDDQRRWGVNTQLGSASDEAFHNWSVIDIGVTAFYSQDKSEESTWVYLLNYSNQRSFLPHIPLPGFIYIYNNKQGLMLLAGIPVVGFNYMATPKFMITLFSIIPWTHNFKLTYFLSGRKTQIYTEYKISPESYKLVDYKDSEDRVILDDHKAIAGIKFPLVENLSMDIHAGHSMNRKIYQAKRPGASTDWEENLEDQAFFNVQFGIVF